MKWCIPAVRAYTIDHLDPLIQRGVVHPAVALSFGRRHGIPSWIEPAVRRLKALPMGTWSAQAHIMCWMTLDTYQIVTRLREKLHEKRAALALPGPRVTHSDDCQDRTTCSGSWEMSWMFKVGKKLLNPIDEWRPTITEIRRAAESIVVPEMTPLCFGLTMESVLGSKAWDFEDHGVQKAVELLMVEEMDVAFAPGGDPMDI